MSFVSSTQSRPELVLEPAFSTDAWTASIRDECAPVRVSGAGLSSDLGGSMV